MGGRLSRTDGEWPSVGDDGDSGGAAETVGAGLDHGDGSLAIADAAGRLDLDARARRALHEADVLESRAGGAEARAGLDEVSPGLGGETAGANDLVVAQVAGLEDDLEGQAGAGRLDLLDVLADRVVVAREERADVDDHVDLLRAELDGVGGLEDLGRGGARTEREAHHGADLHVGAVELAELVDAEADPVRVDAHRGEAVFDSLFAEADDVGAGGGGLEGRVVDVASESAGVHGKPPDCEGQISNWNLAQREVEVK